MARHWPSMKERPNPPYRGIREKQQRCDPTWKEVLACHFAQVISDGQIDYHASVRSNDGHRSDESHCREAESEVVGLEGESARALALPPISRYCATGHGLVPL